MRAVSFLDVLTQKGRPFGCFFGSISSVLMPQVHSLVLIHPLSREMAGEFERPGQAFLDVFGRFFCVLLPWKLTCWWWRNPKQPNQHVWNPVHPAGYLPFFNWCMTSSINSMPLKDWWLVQMIHFLLIYGPFLGDEFVHVCFFLWWGVVYNGQNARIPEIFQSAFEKPTKLCDFRLLKGWTPLQMVLSSWNAFWVWETIWLWQCSNFH